MSTGQSEDRIQAQEVDRKIPIVVVIKIMVITLEAFTACRQQRLAHPIKVYMSLSFYSKKVLKFREGQLFSQGHPV